MSFSQWSAHAGTAPSPSHPDDCQDSAAVFENDYGDVLVAVADGVASASHATFASRNAVSLVGELFGSSASVPRRPDLLVEWLGLLMSQCRSQFVEVVSAAGYGVEDCSTTLLFLVLAGDLLGYGSIGDSFIVVRDKLCGVKVLLEPERADNEARSVTWTLDDAEAHSRYGVYDASGLEAVCVSTDGLEKYLRYRGVRGLDDRMRQAVWGVNVAIERLMERYTKSCSASELEFVDRPDVRSSKGDDIGVALAARRPA